MSYSVLSALFCWPENKNKTIKTTDNHTRKISNQGHFVFNLWNNSDSVVKTHRDGLAFMFKPLLRVKVCYLPPRQEGIINIQVHFLQTGQLCTLLKEMTTITRDNKRNTETVGGKKVKSD